MGLDISKAPILSEEERAEFVEPSAFLAEIMDSMKTRGLGEYPRPNTAPPNLAEIDAAELPNALLGQYYTQYTAHAQFVSGEVAKAVAVEKLLVGQLKHLTSKLKLKLYAHKDIPKDEIMARVTDDALYMSYEFETVKARAIRELLEAHYRAYSTSAKALSRLIKLRELEFDLAMRENGIQNKRKTASRPVRGNFRGSRGEDD